MEKQNSVHLHVHLLGDETLHLHVHEGQSGGRECHDSKQEEDITPRPNEAPPFVPVPPSNLHWSCWPDPKNRPKTAPATCREHHRKFESRHHWSYWPEPPARGCSRSRMYMTDEDEENLEPTCDRVFGEDLMRENESPDKDKRTVNPLGPSDYVRYLPRPNISVNQLPRDSYTMYSQPRWPQGQMPPGISVGYPYTRKRFPQKKFGDQYVHQFSTFSLTSPRCRGHFTIHPDWVSEKCGLKRPR